MLTALLSRLVILVFGTLYPAFASYKAIRCKDIKGYVKWTMYWVVFALFITVETFTDILLSWLPFYYEIKIALVVWLMSPATHGSSLLYKHLLHPWLRRNEAEIEQCVQQARQHGYAAVMTLGSRGVSYATQMLLQTALAGGSGLVTQLRRSYSVNDVCDMPAARGRAGSRDDHVLAAISDELEEGPRHHRRHHRRGARRRQSADMSTCSGVSREVSEDEEVATWPVDGAVVSGARRRGGDEHSSVEGYCTLRRSARRSSRR